MRPSLSGESGRGKIVAMTCVGRLARHVATLVSMLVLLSPIWLGPAMHSLSGALGGTHHVCACGMAMGKCGCPACARIARQRDRDFGSPACPVLKSMCDDDSAALPSAPLPPCDLQGAIGIRKSAAEGLLPPPMLAQRLSLDGEGPPTPPPRASSL